MDIHNKNKEKIINEHKIVIKNVNKMSSDKYKCDFCLKTLSSRQSKWRHDKICVKKLNVEKRLEILEKTIIDNIDSDLIINNLNNYIDNLKTINEIINILYYDKNINKIFGELKCLITNNIKSYQDCTKILNNYEKNIRLQVKDNLHIINKLEKYIKYLEFQGKKQYLFRNNIKNLKKIEINNTYEIIKLDENLNFISIDQNNKADLEYESSNDSYVSSASEYEI